MSKWELIDGDVSWQHCGRPAYWDYDTDTEDMEVYCSKGGSMRLTRRGKLMVRSLMVLAFMVAIGYAGHIETLGY